MTRGGYFQCLQCGEIHYLDVPYEIDNDELYDIFYCEHCETETKQLWIGENIEDKYLYYSANEDERYF